MTNIKRLRRNYRAVIHNARISKCFIDYAKNRIYVCFEIFQNAVPCITVASTPALILSHPSKYFETKIFRNSACVMYWGSVAQWIIVNNICIDSIIHFLLACYVALLKETVKSSPKQPEAILGQQSCTIEEPALAKTRQFQLPTFQLIK